MPISARLKAVVASLPLSPGMRVLEVGCGTGAAAREVARTLTTGSIVAIDRSATAVTQARSGSVPEIESGHLTVWQRSIEDFRLGPDDEKFDLVFAVRVGALDGRHPDAGRRASESIGLLMAPGGRLFVGDDAPLAEVPLR